VDVHRRLRAARTALGLHHHALLREREIVSALRRAIQPVPAGPTEINGVRLVVEHRPADRHAQVGGDWCDWRPLPGNRLLLAVGDAVGHGLDAAATMVRLRYAATALATSGLPPNLVLTTLNSLLWSADSVEIGELATALLAVYDRDNRELTWASAGHPPIVFADATGAAWAGSCPHGPMLGAYRDPAYACATSRLRRDDLVVLYTDGFVEDRRSAIDEGIETLLAAVRASAGVGCNAPFDDALARLAPRNPDDDACLLAAYVAE
jgi:serine phosphatase RsbU (regulator of sigma subunit)